MLEIRPAVPDDADAIVRLAREVQAFHVAARPDLFKPGGGVAASDVVERMGRGDHLYWVATVEGTVAGYAYARLSEEPESRWKWRARSLTLDEMGVARQHQRRGLGRRLVEAVRLAAEERGVDRVILNVWAFNTQAQRFYEQMGFAPFHQLMALEIARRAADRNSGRPLGAELPRTVAGTGGRLRKTPARDFLDLVAARHGHFRLESGHHGALWLDLDALFADPRRVDPFVATLATALRPYGVAAVCGPLLGGAFLAQLVARALGAEFCFTERVLPPQADGLYRARYRLPAAFGARLFGRRVAIVDDVMSAGSALRGTHAELEAHGAKPVVAGALLVLGSAGAEYFGERGIPVEAVAREHYELWTPGECPLCAAGVDLEDVAAPAS